MEDMVNLNFYKGKKVFITGHTGFKGSWLCQILLYLGADVIGYSLEAPTEPSLFEIIGLNKRMSSIIGDIRDSEKLFREFKSASPEIVIHLAAQPIVRESYNNPKFTYETNIMGTVNILECVRKTDSVKSFLNVTTDKVYLNREWEWGYREIDPLDGHDPYSNSKSCSELITHSYKNSFFEEREISISTARAGNVIGGGDFAEDRIIPDCIRAALKNDTIIVRNPYSTRPYQHVLEPLSAYLLIVQAQYLDKKKADWYNVGPDDMDCVTTGELAELFCVAWGDEQKWKNLCQGGPHEANCLKLDSSKIRTNLGWKPRWHIAKAIEKTCNWTKAWSSGSDIMHVMNNQIKEYFEG